MASNINPIYSRVADIQGGVLLGNFANTLSTTSLATDYTGQPTFNIPIFNVDAVNGGYIQKIRFKAAGTNVAALARIYINDGDLNTLALVGSLSAVTPTGTPFTTGGTLLGGTTGQNYYAKVQAIGGWGGHSIVSQESLGVTVASGTTAGSIVWSWTASSGPVDSYRVFVGGVSGGEYVYFDTGSATASFTQTQSVIAGQYANPVDGTTTNMFIGEVSLPATTASNVTAGVEIDYPLNIALPPGYRILVGMHSTAVLVSGGWVATVFGGKY